MIRTRAVGWKAWAALDATDGAVRVLAPLAASTYVAAGGELGWLRPPPPPLPPRPPPPAAPPAPAPAAALGAPPRGPAPAFPLARPAPRARALALACAADDPG